MRKGGSTKNGQTAVVEVIFTRTRARAWLTIYQEDLRKVGIALNLRLVTPETRFQLGHSASSTCVAGRWGPLTFPNPETSFQSKLADVPDTNNITGFKDRAHRRADRPLRPGVRSAEARGIIREIDGILANLTIYILEWDAPFQRSRTGTKNSVTRMGISAASTMTTRASSLWWIDPEREQS